MLDLKALLRVPYVDPYNGFALSPDGQKAAFSWNHSGQWEIYEIQLDGASNPRVISRGPGGKFAPKYSPDGSHLAYVVDFDGGERYHLFLHELSSDRFSDLTPGIHFSLQPNLAWSPDGDEIAFLADRSGQFDAYVMSLSTPSPAEEMKETAHPVRRILAIDRPGWNVKWSPSGDLLAVVFEGPGQEYLTYFVRRDGGESWPISLGGEPIDARNPAWSPDGTQLAFVSDLHGCRDIAVYNLQQNETTWLTQDEVEQSFPDWSPDGTGLVYVSAKGTDTHLSVWRGTESLLNKQVEAGLHSLPKFTPDGKSIVFIFDNPRNPCDLWRLSIPDGHLRRLTDSLPIEMRAADLVMPEEIYYPGKDGVPVPALLYQSGKTDPNCPAVVVIHGGPNWHFSFSWNAFMTHLASRGWTVLAPNYRGSTGYGRAWQTANRFDLGGVDSDDCAAGALHLIRQKMADPKRIVVTGRSHGGFLTMSCLTRFPDLWAGGSAVVPFLNWFTAHANSREDLRHWDIENMGHPDENHELWHERSPYFYLDRVNAPVQLICGENDPRCAPQDSLDAYHKLLEYGNEVDFKMYAGEGHAFLKNENVIDSETRRVEFLARCIEKKRYS